MSAVVFDFDGPLFDGRAAARDAIQRTGEHFRERWGAPTLRFDHLPLLAPRFLVALLYAESSLSDDAASQVEAFYRKQLEAIEGTLSTPQEMRELLQRLRRGGCKVAILSSRRSDDLQQRVGQLGLEHLVDIVHGRDSLANPKPHPGALTQIAQELGIAVADLILVGDSDADFQCAAGAGVPYYHVAWSGEPSTEAPRRAAAVFSTPRDLLEALSDAGPVTATADDDPLPKDLLEAISGRDLCFYAGSGVSVKSGIGDWDGHYGGVLKTLGAGFLAAEGSELPEVLQLLAAQQERARQVYDAFRRSFDQPDREPNFYHYAMLRAQPARIWTSNYDRLFERANAISGFGYEVATNDRTLLERFRRPRLIIKMNGDFEAARYSDDLDWDLVFTQEQFDVVERQRPEIWRLFEDDYRTRCIVFVGVSFKDAALRRIVAVARQKIPRTRFNHYLLARRSNDPLQRRKDALQADNLRRQSIRTLFFSDFEAIERFVAQVAVARRQPVVGFSGSFRSLARATDEEIASSTVKLPGGSLTPGGVREVLAGLGRSLAENGYRVTSGCSPIVGIPPVTAAFEAQPTRARFYLRAGGGTKYTGTAPAVVVPAQTGGDRYAPMRNQFVSELSLLVACGGSDNPKGRRSGALDEIELAMERSIPILLLPQVGGAVAAERKVLLAKIDRCYPDPAFAEAIRQLNENVASVPADALARFASGELVMAIGELMRRLFGSSLRVGHREAGSTDW